MYLLSDDNCANANLMARPNGAKYSWHLTQDTCLPTREPSEQVIFAASAHLKFERG
jgi:hypothetical protein